MKHGLVVAVGGAALVIAGLSGCSSEENSSTSGETSTAAAAEGTTAVTAEGTTTVRIDGQEQQVQGAVVCSSMEGNTHIAVGDATTGIGAVVSSGDNPTVHSVGLGNVNGVTLGYTSGTGQGEANVEKAGNTYTITGTATGINMANPLQPVDKPFEIEVTCP